MDVAEQAQYMVVGQADSLSLMKLPKFEKIWEKHFGAEENQNPANSARSKKPKQQ